MKKVFFACALIFGAFAAKAQTDQGNMMLGGTLQFQSTSYQASTANETSQFTLAPNFGYFLSDNFAVGLGFTFVTERTGTGDAKTTSNAFAMGPFARYYIFTDNSQFGFFGQAGLSFGGGKNDPGVKSSYINFALSPGAAFFFNDHWALELAVTALNIRSNDPNKDVDNDKRTTFSFGLTTLAPSVGIRYHF